MFPKILFSTQLSSTAPTIPKTSLEHRKTLQTLQTYYNFDWKKVLSIVNTGLFEMIVGVVTTCHTQYT